MVPASERESLTIVQEENAHIEAGETILVPPSISENTSIHLGSQRESMTIIQEQDANIEAGTAVHVPPSIED